MECPLTIPAEVGALLLEPQASRGRRYRITSEHTDLQIRTTSGRIRWITSRLQELVGAEITGAMIAEAQARVEADKERIALAKAQRIRGKSRPAVAR